MELKQLQYFVTSVDLGSFKKAADALYTTQPHVSKTIKALEDELGLTLFDRHPVGVTITEAGKQVYTHASDILRRCGQIAQVEADGGCEPLHVAERFSGRPDRKVLPRPAGTRSALPRGQHGGYPAKTAPARG